MSALSWTYVAGNLWARKISTSLTAIGMMLVCFVFALVLMMAEGLHHTLAGTGARDNLIFLRQGAQTEVQSTLSRTQSAILASEPGWATDAHGQALVSRELLVLVNLRKKAAGAWVNVVVRGITPLGWQVHAPLRLQAGRMFRPGHSEVIVGAGVARGEAGVGLGDLLHFGQRDWRVVGVFSSARSGFESEIWGDEGQMRQAFRRDDDSSWVGRLRDEQGRVAMLARVAADPRLPLHGQRESDFYARQSRTLAQFIRVLGQAITLVFSLGATLGAMITMYASVAQRTREIGTLRALGFYRRDIVLAFLREAMLLALIAGVVAILIAASLQSLEISTTNVQTFSEISFRLVLTPAIVAEVLLFALAMGLVGGVLPALQAARLEIIDALRAY